MLFTTPVAIGLLRPRDLPAVPQRHSHEASADANVLQPRSAVTLQRPLPFVRGSVSRTQARGERLAGGCRTLDVLLYARTVLHCNLVWKRNPAIPNIPLGTRLRQQYPTKLGIKRTA
jgi:hypothetical protein